MRLFKVTIVLISLLLSTSAMAGNKTPGDAEGQIGNMPAPKWLGDDLKYSMPAFLFRRTQFLRFSLKRDREEDARISGVLRPNKHTERQDSQLVQQGASGRGQGACYTLIPNLGWILPYVPSIHQGERQGTTHD